MAHLLKVKVRGATKILTEIGMDIAAFLAVVVDLLVLVDDFFGVTELVTSKCTTA